MARLLQEPDQGADAEFEVLQVELLIGSMDVVVGEAEAHHDAGQAEVTIEVADDGDGAAGADEDGVFAPDFVEGAGGGLDVLVVDRDQAGVAGVDETDVDVNTGGSDLFDVALVLREGFCGVIPGTRRMETLARPWRG